MVTIEPLLKKLDEIHDFSQEAFDEVAKLTIIYKKVAAEDPTEFLRLLNETQRNFGKELDTIGAEQVRGLLGGSNGAI